MPLTQEKSVEDLREKSEQTREDLAATVTELRERVGSTATELKTMASPSHIKEEIRGYVRQEKESLVQSLQRQVKENPLQAAAIGAAIAYPALGFLRALPTPVWLIGAGLLLTSKRGQQFTEESRAKLGMAVQQGKEKVADLADAIQSDLQDRTTAARYTLGETKDAIASKVDDVADRARATMHDMRDGLSRAGQGVGSIVDERSDNVASAADVVDSVKSHASHTTSSVQQSVANFVKDNPILVAGVGAAVGAFLAASIPPSEAENRLFGPGSDKLKNKAREAAADSIEKAGDFVTDAAGSMAAAAAREGLDATGVQSALSKVADSVRIVADRGIDTALGANTQSQAASAAEPSSERNPT
jgi:ElaB/YqjD/DUF883 family membrane-anchored ribosome-binding protein